VLERVFRRLCPRDLKAAVLVCRRWREVGEAPKLWTWVWRSYWPLFEHYRGREIRKLSDPTKVVQVFGSRRLQNMTSLKIVTISEELLRAVAVHPSIRELDICEADIPTADPVLLAEALTKVERVYTGQSNLQMTYEQILVLFTVMWQGCQLIAINFDFGLSAVPPTLFAQAIRKLETAKFHDCNLSEPQVTALLKMVREGKSNLKTLKLSGNDLDGLPPALFAQAINKLEAFELNHCGLTETHITYLLEMVRDGDTSLKSLRLGSSRTEHVSPNLIAGSLTKLEKVEICDQLHPQQLNLLLSAIASGTCKLKNLALKFLLEEVEPSLLASAVCQLEIASFSSESLSSEHLKAMFSQTKTKLRRLGLGRLDIIEQEDLQVMATAINQLERFDLNELEFPMESQVTAILTKSLEKTNLRMLHIGTYTDGVSGPGLGYSESWICKDLIASARNFIPYIDLDFWPADPSTGSDTGSEAGSDTE